MNNDYVPDPDHIKLWIRRFTPRDHRRLQSLGDKGYLTWKDIENYAEEMRKPHVDALEKIRQHLFELSATRIEQCPKKKKSTKK